MPSGKTHNKINQSILISCVIAASIKPFDGAWWAILGLAIGINYLGPDLDKNGTMQDQNWGVFGTYWDIYSKLMPHRGFSHSIFGIASRILFLVPPVILMMYVSKKYNGSYFSIKIDREAILICIGIVIADLLHIIEDKIIKEKKR